MTSGADTPRGSARPARFRTSRAETLFYTGTYHCPCGTTPWIHEGRVLVEHEKWCPIRVMKQKAMDAATRIQTL